MYRTSSTAGDQPQHYSQEPRSYSQEFVAMPVSPHGSEVSEGVNIQHLPSTHQATPPDTPQRETNGKGAFARLIVRECGPTLSYISDTPQAVASPVVRRRTNPEVKPSKASIASSTSFDLGFNKQLVSDDKRINNSIFYLDVSPGSKVLASKHGNNILKIWGIENGTLESSIKFTSYTEAHSRSRDYLIRSHAILSEASNLIAVASRFGRTIEIWNWGKKKCLQTLDDADRWTAASTEAYGGHGGCSPLAVYRADDSRIDLFTATQEKKPFAKQRSIDLKQANLPFVPQYPELALSATSPLLVAAAGPRPPRAGHPPPEKETLLVAWDTNTDGYGSNKPFRVARPWQHEEISTAIPCDLCAYGSVVVSIWIPASFRAMAVPPSRGGTGYNLVPVKVPSRYVLVWDISANSTHTFAIPNCTACVSPDCRYVAYCHASGTGIGARGCLCVLDVMDGREVWCWPDKDALAIDSGPKPGFEQFNDLSLVTELAFSPDGRCLIIADRNGRMSVYNSIGPDDALAYSVTQLADDVECVIRTLQLRPFILVGHSMGAKVSQVVAGRKAIEGLLGLVLVSPAPPSPLTLPPEMREEQRHAYDNPESAEFVTRNVLTASPLQQAVVDHIVADMIKGNEYAKSAWPAYGMNSNIVSDAMRIDVPTLVVGASKDIVEPIARIQTELCTVIRHAELDIVDGSGHLIPIEAPDKLALIILSVNDHGATIKSTHQQLISMATYLRSYR
ncbi:WD40 repeat-like-containing domain [Purpureocillium lavendulum]|uniref:WD40 repeat-like-containing domain n=1 Tax=Purpureocillium lavendulum TaxID=1247861 RepID=A0AB34G0H3_9HYPO|nr:WD40 repeat-like-containing domain [Purpureocillium lavendulum]